VTLVSPCTNNGATARSSLSAATASIGEILTYKCRVTTGARCCQSRLIGLRLFAHVARLAAGVGRVLARDLPHVRISEHMGHWGHGSCRSASRRASNVPRCPWRWPAAHFPRTHGAGRGRGQGRCQRRARARASMPGLFGHGRIVLRRAEIAPARMQLRGEASSDAAITSSRPTNVVPQASLVPPDR